MEHDEERTDGRRSGSRDSRTTRIELAQRRLESALATPNSPSSPWSTRSLAMGLAVGSPTTTTGASPAHLPRGLRSVSFSSEPDHRFPGTRRTDPTFPSTFEDNESEASIDDVYFEPSPRRSSPSALLPRTGGLYASIGANGMPVNPSDPSGTRSRSQSLATLGRRPMPTFPSSPLPAPGSQGLPQSWADSRFGIPAPIHNTHNFHQVPRQDLSNISPFVRDVGQIFQEDPREFWPGEESGGGGSGTTSRRHSVSVVQPRGRFGPQLDAFAQGRSVISDDDLLGNMLSLDLDDSTPPRNNPVRVMPATFNPRGPLSGGGSGLVSQPSSLPTYPAPIQRHSPVGALGLHEHNSPRASTLDYVPENGTSGSWRQTHNPSPERSAGAFGARPSLAQLRTDSLRSAERGFSPSLSPNTGRGYSFQGQQQTVYERQSSLGLGLTTNTAPGAGYTRDQQQQPSTNTPSQSHFPGSSPRTTHRPFPVSPSAMRTSFGPVQTPLSPGAGPGPNPGQQDADLGRGLPLSSIPTGAPLYVVEFKAGRTDLFFAPDSLDGEPIRRGDLVIVEADRGKDLGKVVNDSISLAEVERFMMEGADDGQGGRKEIMPKRIYGRAGPGDTQLLLSKMQDEVKALQLCQSKIRQKKLPMEVIDAEYQWSVPPASFTIYTPADEACVTSGVSCQMLSRLGLTARSPVRPEMNGFCLSVDYVGTGENLRFIILPSGGSTLESL
ncbi:PSP1 protein [Rhizoctonia solani]|uniref:PSP1 protein n=1 Tax=Rhizoctonia solani TaxID=456999 RepID=A0A8H7HBL0_9AGAM|nr:PSP1 protein [Rhizoctonia solani]